MLDRCENACMRKPYKTYKTAVTVIAAGLMLLGNARAQQTPASTPPEASPAKTTTSSATKAPAAKAGSATTAAKAPAVKSPNAMELKTEKDKLSYAIGVNVGRGLRKDSVDIDANVLTQGLIDALSGGKTLITEDEAKALITAFQTDLRKKQDEAMQAAGEANKKLGEAYLAANKTKDGVVTLPSGLQYKVLTEGKGPKPTASDTVVCNYKGTLIDGTEFDSSYKRGQPATFAVVKVIKGWTEALQLMPVGSKWELYIPSEMAYGPRGPTPAIGANSALIFEVELLSIQAQAQAK
jgi:FKBP-type peptidyl-prolyl cis-trans isomerase